MYCAQVLEFINLYKHPLYSPEELGDQTAGEGADTLRGEGREVRLFVGRGVEGAACAVCEGVTKHAFESCIYGYKI